jgi:hypothetical protein
MGRDTAARMRRVEEQIEANMSLFLHDWKLYQVAKAERTG